MRNYIILGVLLLLSIGINVWFFSGKGINVTKNTYITNDQRQWQQQYSGQLMIQQWMVQGNKVEWKHKAINDFKSIDELIAFRNAMPPDSSYFSSIVEIQEYPMNHYPYNKYLIWPDIYTKTKDELKSTK